MHKETRSKRPEQVYLPSHQDWNDLERGHYLSRTPINAWGQNGTTIQIIRGQLLKSGLRPLAKYGTHQEIISGRPEQKYLPSTKDWNSMRALMGMKSKFQILFLDL